MSRFLAPVYANRDQAGVRAAEEGDRPAATRTSVPDPRSVQCLDPSRRRRGERFDPFEGIKCYAVTSGACWIAVDGAGEPVLLRQGDCFLLPHGWPFRVASDLILPSDDWKRHFLGSRDGTLVKLNGGGDVTVLGGHFQLAGPGAQMLVGMLPPIVHLQSEADRETLRWAFDRMRQELADAKPGTSWSYNSSPT